MQKYVITITRQFGSLGRPIAHQLSELLEVEYYDRDIVEQVSRKMNLPISQISESEEKAKSLFFNMKYPLGTATTQIQDQIFKTQREIILDLAEKESCIIVGRCSDYILEGLKNHISIFIYAPYEARLKNCVDNLHMTRAEGEKMIAEVDRARDSYHMRYANYLPGDFKHKDLMINSSVLGVEGTAGYIADLIHTRFADKQ